MSNQSLDTRPDGPMMSLSRLDHNHSYWSMAFNGLVLAGKIETVENMVKLPPTLKSIGSAAFNVPFVQFFVYSEIIIYLCASDAFLVTGLPIQAEAPPSSLLSYSKKHPEWCILRDPNFGQPLISWVYCIPVFPFLLAVMLWFPGSKLPNPMFGWLNYQNWLVSSKF